MSLFSCSSDDETPSSTISTWVQGMREVLTGDQVLMVQVTMAGVDMTHLPGGCPAKFAFEWGEGEDFSIRLQDFKVGNMPVTINFRCPLTATSPSEWDAAELGEGQWVKLSGRDGTTSMSGSQEKTQEGSSVVGFYNAATGELQFDLDFNMMGVKVVCPRQGVNPCADYDALNAQYLADLADWKAEH